MAEHVAVDTFRIVDATVQMKGGTFAAFVRWVDVLVEPLQAFFARTRHDYRRFNYVGEWHSHYSFALSPSPKDVLTMREIVNDPGVGANFVVLLLVRVRHDRLEGSVSVYLPRGITMDGTVELEDSAQTCDL